MAEFQSFILHNIVGLFWRFRRTNQIHYIW